MRMRNSSSTRNRNRPPSAKGAYSAPDSLSSFFQDQNGLRRALPASGTLPVKTASLRRTVTVFSAPIRCCALHHIQQGFRHPFPTPVPASTPALRLILTVCSLYLIRFCTHYYDEEPCRYAFPASGALPARTTSPRQTSTVILAIQALAASFVHAGGINTLPFPVLSLFFIPTAACGSCTPGSGQSPHHPPH